MSTLVLLPFDDDFDHLRPKDAAGNLDTLGVQAGIAAPVVADAFTGRGRDFVASSLRGYLAADAADGDSLTIRDASVQVLTTIRASSAASWPRALYVRGLADGTAAERYALGVEVNQVVAGADPVLELRLFWQDSAGALKTQLGGTFHAPAADTFVLLTATRRWESASKVVCRYYVNDQLVLEIESVDGDIAGATTGTTSIGARKNAGAWGRHWDGIVDQLKVVDYEMSAEQVRETWRRLTVHQPAGVEMLTAMAPPGSRWGRDPERNDGKLTRWMGTALGYALAKAEELRATFLPDGAYEAMLRRWEKVYRVPPPHALESLDVRRTRVQAFVGRTRGYSAPLVADALVEPLGVTAAADLELVRFTNRIDDAFDALSTERWWAEPAGLWTISAGELYAEQVAGADMRWNNSVKNWYRCVLPVSRPQQGGPSVPEGDLIVLSKFSQLSASSDALVGLHVFNFLTGDGIWFGHKFDGAATALGYVCFKDGVQGAFQTLLTPSAVTPIWLRLRKPNPGLTGQWVFGWSTTGAETGFTEQTVNNLMESDVDWAGYGMLGLDAATAATNRIAADDFTLINPGGLRPFNWYVYRDAAIDGDPDWLGANALIRKMKPSETHGAAIQSKSLLCDNVANGGCDRGPMGGL